MEKTKKILNRIFIDGLSGMALGLFSTLIIGTIIAQIGTLIGGPVGSYLKAISNVAKTLTGAGIGVGVACKFKEGPLVTVSAAVAGMIGAFPAAPEAITLGAPGEPLGAFVAAYVAIEVGHLVAGKTKVDILVTPLISICAGAAIGLFVGPYITDFMKWLGGLVNVNVEQSPIFGGIIVSVLMGMILTLPISSAAIGISMGLTGLAQGVGTSMLQIPNIVRRPIIWIPAIVSSAILGPVASAVLHMVSTPVGSGMGSAGFVGQIAAFGAMTEAGMSTWMALIQIAIMHFILPALLTLGVSEFMRKKGWIREGDMALKV